MGEFTQMYHGFSNYYVQWNQLGIPYRLIGHFNPFKVRFKHCVSSGMPLTDQYMYHTGAATKCLDESEYQRIFVQDTRPICKVCGSPLPGDKARRIMMNPREVMSHIHDGECMAYWTMLHSAVVDPQATVHGLQATQAMLQGTFRTQHSYMQPNQGGTYPPFQPRFDHGVQERYVQGPDGKTYLVTAQEVQNVQARPQALPHTQAAPAAELPSWRADQ